MGNSKGKSRKSARSSKSHTRKQMGGNLNGNPASAWGWGMGTLGNGWQQFMNSLSLQPGENLGTIQSNASVPIGNINAQSSQGMIGPYLRGDIPQGGGKKRRNHRSRGSRSKRGGGIGAAVNQALVPLTLFATNIAVGKSMRNRKYKK